MRYRPTRPDPILPLLVLGGTAALLYSFLRGQRRSYSQARLGDGTAAGQDERLGRARGGKGAALSSKVADEAIETDCDGFVRPAGTEAMRDPPRRWDQIDEQGDESFPASDPPGNY